jgi:PIN domain nuclease of toxin-antitoxin system
MGLDGARRQIHPPAPAHVILLDTNALIWLEQGHARAKKLAAAKQRLCISPVSVLELQFLQEAGRLRVRGGGTIADLVEHGPWLLDDPPSAALFDAALDLGWTRDPFDRLLVAHARLRGWRLATGDTALLARLPERHRMEV